MFVTSTNLCLIIRGHSVDILGKTTGREHVVIAMLIETLSEEDILSESQVLNPRRLTDEGDTATDSHVSILIYHLQRK